MSINSIPIFVLASLTLILGCSKSDREQAAKTEDGTSTFRYQPGDRAKYRKKEEATSERSPSPSSKQPAASLTASKAPKAPEK